MIPILIGNIAAFAMDAISSATHSHGPEKKDRFDDMLSQLQQTQEPDSAQGTEPAPGTEATKKT